MRATLRSWKAASTVNELSNTETTTSVIVDLLPSFTPTSSVSRTIVTLRVFFRGVGAVGKERVIWAFASINRRTQPQHTNDEPFRDQFLPQLKRRNGQRSHCALTISITASDSQIFRERRR
jgi:hypothetical protein